jgi:hypothetical protein
MFDYRDLSANKEILDYINSPECTEPTKRFKKVAALGITGMKKVLLNAVTRANLKAFDSEEEAKDWLVK